MGAKYRCPYCDTRLERDKLISHIELKHKEMIPQDYTASRVVFNLINKKEHGNCIICKKETKWNENTCRYEKFCSEKCRKVARERALNNMIKVYNKPTLLNDDEHQRKMLSHRHISGTYTFQDGGKKTYTGSYERKTLEFFDKVMNCSSKDIETPGPSFKYDHNGVTRTWITDIYYIPYNLVIEVKDGGNNPNTRNMEEYRDKQVKKEKMITELGTYNYLRLTNNNFGQLLSIMAELKMQFLEDPNDKKAIIRINEVMALASCNPPIGAMQPCVVNYGEKKMIKANSENLGLLMDRNPKYIMILKDKKLTLESTSEFLKDRMFNVYHYKGDRTIDDISRYYNEGITIDSIYEFLSNKTLYSSDQIEFDECFTPISDVNSHIRLQLESIMNNMHKDRILLPLIRESDIEYRDKIIHNESYDIMTSPEGYVLYDKDTNLTISEAVDNIEDIERFIKEV